MSAPTPVSPLRRHRSELLIGLVLLAAVVVYVLAGGRGRTSEPLDPDNPSPGGAQALARVLEQQGVQVTVVRSAAALERASVDETSTVLVTSTRLLGASTAERLLAHTRGARLIVAQPGPGAAESLGLPAGSPAPQKGPVPAACSGDPLQGLVIEVPDATQYPSPRGCFPGDDGYLVARPTARVTVLGASSILSNREIVQGDNAAVAARLLGGGPRLVWYVPALTDLNAGDGVSLSTLLPRWLKPGVWVTGLAVLALMLWRGRRLGPLAVEPLPVVVKAIETTRSRGRLYRRANDRHHAAQVLRAAARTRLATRLRLPAGTDADLLSRHLAPQLGLRVEELRVLLDPATPAPTSDRDLITLANRLDELDREARRT